MNLGSVAHPSENNLFLDDHIIYALVLIDEGFELVPYDYDDISEPRRTVPRALYLSVAVVAFVYVAVTIASQMLLPESSA